MEKQIELAKSILESKGYIVTKKVNESTDSEWEYWEMPENYGGPFTYPHYNKQYSENILGTIYPPYESKSSYIDSFDDFNAVLYDDESTDKLAEKNFDNMEDAKNFLDTEFNEYMKRFPKEQR